MTRPRASVVITSYNYGRFLRAAIDSALVQRESAATEVIVVDDGSDDDSPDIIRSYGDAIVPVLKSNAGQGSSFNVGAQMARGDVVLFLDSDDVLLPGAVENALANCGGGVAKVHWRMRVIDEAGERTGKLVPNHDLSAGDLREAVLRDGPDAYAWPPTSGNAWSRAFLQRVLPMPEKEYSVCPDLYLSALVPVFGEIRKLDEPQSCWRLHGANNTWAEPFDQRLDRLTERWDLAAEALASRCSGVVSTDDVRRWKANSWLHRVRRSVAELIEIVPPGEPLVLIDDNDWGVGGCTKGRPVLPFLEVDGEYWGSPGDDADATAELWRLRVSRGAKFVALAWPAFWWQEHYPLFLDHLHREHELLLQNDRLLVFRMSGGDGGG